MYISPVSQSRAETCVHALKWSNGRIIRASAGGVHAPREASHGPNSASDARSHVIIGLTACIEAARSLSRQLKQYTRAPPKAETNQSAVVFCGILHFRTSALINTKVSAVLDPRTLFHAHSATTLVVEPRSSTVTAR